MKTEADKRSRAQASNPKSREFVDVSGQVFRTGILLNETLYLAFEPLPQGLKIERQFLARLEPDRLEASSTDDDEALGRGTRSAKWARCTRLTVAKFATGIGILCVRRRGCDWKPSRTTKS